MGQVTPRGRGKWLVRVFLGRDENGERKFLNRTVTGTKRDAENWAHDRERERDSLGAGALKALNLTVGGLLGDLEADYSINNKSAEWCRLVVKTHLRPFFGGMPVAKVGSDAIRQYIGERRERGIANGTINRELSLLRRAFNLAAAADPPKVAKVPRIPKLEEASPRSGFFKHDEYTALMRELPDHLRPVLAFAYQTGCQKGEILTMQWNQVDLVEGIVHLEPGTTKSGDARQIPLADELLAILRMQRARRDAECPDSPWVFFHPGGGRIHGLREPWVDACRRAGLWQGDEKGGKPTRLFHDLRRTGVRNLVRAGTPEAVAQRISGHRTRSVFDRCNIVSKADLKRAAANLQTYLQSREAEAARHTARETDFGSSHTIVTQ